MQEKKTVKIPPVIITSLCAVIWNIQLFIDLFSGDTNEVTFFLHIVCAIIWDICAVSWIVRYIRR